MYIFTVQKERDIIVDCRALKMLFYLRHVLILLFATCQTLLADELDFYVSLSRVTPENGLTNSQVKCITEDSLGYIWFGTNNGLFCYDTKEIRQFKHSRNDYTSIPSNRINILYTDRTGRVWVGTNNGLCYYDRLRGNFRRLNIMAANGDRLNNVITSFSQLDESVFWFTNSEGLGMLDIETGIAEYINIESESTGSAIRVFPDESLSVWVFYNSGEIYLREKDATSFRLFSRIPDFTIRSVYVDDKNLWIGYLNDGLLCLNRDGTTKMYYTAENELKSRLPDNHIRSIIKTSEDQIWAATYHGVVILENYHVKKVVDPQKYFELPHHSVWSLFEDSKKNIWIGTWKGGLCFHSKYNHTFHQYNVTSKIHPASNNYVTCITKIPNSNELLIGTESEGTFVFNPNASRFDQLPVISGKDTVTNIKYLIYDQDGTLWVGAFMHGVLYKKRGESSFRKLNPPFKQGMQAFHMLVTDNGIWVCDYPQGVYYHDFESGLFKRYQHNPYDIRSISNNNVRKIYQDKNGDLWFITENGLNLLKKETSEFIHFFYQADNPKSISSNDIFDIYEDESGKLLLGTNGYGLDIFDPVTGEAIKFSTADGLAGDEIFSITRDYEGYYWLATDNGLSKFNIKTGEIKTLSTTRLINNRFSPLASLSLNDNEVYFGGSGGLVRFSPREINKNPHAPKTLITRLFINNKEIRPDNGNEILSDIITNTNSLKLKYFQNSIRLSFIADNYIHAEGNSFVYRLKGFNDEWIESGKDGEATFTNISPGKYTFEVKASNQDGVWNETPTSIFIRIIPPLWFRWYAFVFYSLVVISIIVFYRNQLINKQRLITEVKLAKMKNQVDERLHQMKLQFFTNISHEFRTPLTLISGPVSRLIRNKHKFPDETKDQLKLVKKNVDRLLRLVNQFLDYREIEFGKMELNPIKTDIVSFCRDITEFFSEATKIHNINFVFKSDSDRLLIDFDMDKLEKAIFNLLSNAFKYTPNGGQVKLEISNNKKRVDPADGIPFIIGDMKSEDFVDICISDTGKGIHPEQINKVFTRFYHGVDETNKGSGIGLSLTKEIVLLHRGQIAVTSQPNKGSEFSVRIPKLQPNRLELNLKETQIPSTINSISEETGNLIEPVLSPASFKDALVLIAEDNQDLQNYIYELLKNDFKVARASNGKEALSMAQSLFPDIIISDILMPEMDGKELCKKLKNDITTSHIPVILLTALNSINDEIRGLDLGADSYISKPFNDELILAQIKNLLHSRESLRQLFKSEGDEWKQRFSPEDLDRKFLSKSIQVVKNNMENESFSAKEFAEEMSFSRAHLHRKLKALTNQSATEFIRRVRLKEAVELIKKGELMVSEIGYLVGFKSHTYFTKSFKKQYGLSPKEFKNRKLDQTPRKDSKLSG
jgi:signal transduction histidine kinase/DNA-binding response OmpR family regulator/streptogramin lyase